jgi:NADPH:quinone reductase-like Zn-dependent oxidoreductase
LALDGVGDTATQEFLNAISPFGTVMVWSAMSGKSFSVFGPPLLFRDQTIRGMWIYNWYKILTPEKLTAMYAELVPLVVSGALKFPVAGRFGFDQFLSAIDVASKYNGKAILTPKG